jgi:hypothetical protein
LVFFRWLLVRQENRRIEAVIERCAGIDVGKKFVVVCIMTGPLDGEPRTEIRSFGTMVPDLERLREWLVAEGCSHAVMESTGSYWKPVFNILEDSVQVVLANDGRPPTKRTRCCNLSIPDLAPVREKNAPSSPSATGCSASSTLSCYTRDPTKKLGDRFAPERFFGTTLFVRKGEPPGRAAYNPHDPMMAMRESV